MNKIGINNINFSGRYESLEPETTKKETAKTPEEKKEYFMSKQFSDAIIAQAMADLQTTQAPRLENTNSTKLIGQSFPEIDELDITKKYIDFRTEARNEARSAMIKFYRTFTTGDMSDLVDKQGRIIATFEFPKNQENTESYLDFDACSYKMTEYNPETGEVVAQTKVYNHGDFAKDWRRNAGPYFERIQYGRTPDKNTYLKALVLKEKRPDGKMVYGPKVMIYAEGYQTDGKVTGKRSADKYLSAGMFRNYETYKENYSAPVSAFEAHTGLIPEKGRYLPGEEFDCSIEYPTTQMKRGDEVVFMNRPVVNLTGTKN